MSNILKNTAKFALGTCFTLGTVAVATSIVAGSNAGKIVTAGFKGAKNAMKEELAALKTENISVDVVDTTNNSTEHCKASSADFEN